MNNSLDTLGRFLYSMSPSLTMQGARSLSGYNTKVVRRYNSLTLKGVLKASAIEGTEEIRKCKQLMTFTDG